MTATATATAFRDYIRKITHYEQALNLMYWDLRTGAPKKGAELRSEAIGTIASEIFNMNTSDEMARYLDQLSAPEEFARLDPVTKQTVTYVRAEYNRNKKIPANRFHRYAVLTSQAETVWEAAKEASDFALFRPYLEEIVAMNQEFIGYWGFGENKYDTLLDIYEPGMTVHHLDAIFGKLRDETVQLVRAIVDSPQHVDTSPFLRAFPRAQQRDFSHLMLRRIGYDFGAGRLDETVHPFQTTIHRYDTRVTTKYDVNDFRTALFGTIHEGGHALYEQGIAPELIGTPLSTGTSMGMHESQSRFWENMIGRSLAFWKANFADVQRMFPTQFGNVTLEDFYRGVNDVKPSLIRIEADEVTYNLHIMIRYEIEKGLINGNLAVKDLPEIWREKMQDYLGVTPDNDADGVLQDVHWSDGSFGYFPSYSLGNIYAAQFADAMEKAIPDCWAQVAQGELSAVKAWLNDNIHRHGKMLRPAEIVQQVTGMGIDASYLVQYLKQKYTDIYGLSM